MGGECVLGCTGHLDMLKVLFGPLRWIAAMRIG